MRRRLICKLMNGLGVKEHMVNVPVNSPRYLVVITTKFNCYFIIIFDSYVIQCLKSI